jgi:hypothetical protein
MGVLESKNMKNDIITVVEGTRRDDTSHLSTFLAYKNYVGEINSNKKGKVVCSKEKERRDKISKLIKDVDALVDKKKSLYQQYLEKSEPFKEYWNNLDELLGITTVVEKDTTFGNQKEYGLKLWDNSKLSIDDKYEWFIVGKHPNKNMFKVIGVNKENNNKVSYYLGNNGKHPYLYNTSDIPKLREDGKYNTDNIEEEINEYDIDKEMLGNWLKEVKEIVNRK